MRRRTTAGMVCLAGLTVGLVAGCHKGPAAPPPSAPAAIPVGRPVQRVVTDHVEYTGRTDAVQSVGVRARVTGYLLEVPFKEGAEVKKGDRLFEIDPPPVPGRGRPGHGPDRGVRRVPGGDSDHGGGCP